MARLVPDASATLTWCFEDEAMPWTDALLAKLRAGDEAIVVSEHARSFETNLPICIGRDPKMPLQEVWPRTREFI